MSRTRTLIHRAAVLAPAVLAFLGFAGTAIGAGDRRAPTPPTGLTAVAQTQTSATLSWTRSIDNTAVAGYRILVNGSRVGFTRRTTYTVSGLACGTSSTIQVRALDAAGNASPAARLEISTTSCSGPPCSGVDVSPGADLASLAGSSPPGTVFCIAPGTYRIAREIRPRDGQRFIGTGPGVTISGGVRLSHFSQTGTFWTVTGTPVTPAFDAGSGFTGYLTPQAPYANDVTLDGALLKKIGVETGGVVYGQAPSAVGPGEYFVDYDRGAVYMGSDPTGHDVEIGVASNGFRSTAIGVAIRNLSLELFTADGVDMIPPASGWRIADVAVTAAHDTGIKVSDASIVTGGSASYSGRYGLNAHGSDITIDGVDVSYSDAAAYRDPGGSCVAAGGSKFVGTVNLVLRNSNFHDNWCHGIWFDVDTYNSTVQNNTAVRNQEDGIRFEVSHRALVSGNRVADNGRRGIYLSNTPDVQVYQNTVSQNGLGGVVVNWSGRTTPVSSYGSYAVSNVDVHDNTMILAAGEEIGIVDQTGTGYAYSSAARNLFYRNHYRLTDAAGRYFHVAGRMTWTGWRAVGMDTDGSLF